VRCAAVPIPMCAKNGTLMLCVIVAYLDVFWGAMELQHVCLLEAMD